MAPKMKGLLKGLKCISQLFVQKEHEMEIGYPTDVRHVAHIGWDNLSGSAPPSWMSEFRTSSDFSSASLRQTSWASQDFDQPKELQPLSGIFTDHPCPDIPKAPKKTRKRKAKGEEKSQGLISVQDHQSQESFICTTIEDTNETENKYQMD